MTTPPREAACFFARSRFRGCQSRRTSGSRQAAGSVPGGGAPALDHSRLTRVAELRAIAALAPQTRAARWTALADQILANTGDCLYTSGRWQRAPGDPRVDAALLLPAIRGAVPADDLRSRATLTAVTDDLVEDDYVYRFRHDQRRLAHAEGTFLLCGFTTSLALAPARLRGRGQPLVRTQPRRLRPPGLLAEEYDVRRRQLRGILDRDLARTGFASQQDDRPQDPEHAPNPWEPADGQDGRDHTAYGSFARRATHRSVQRAPPTTTARSPAWPPQGSSSQRPQDCAHAGEPCRGADSAGERCCFLAQCCCCTRSVRQPATTTPPRLSASCHTDSAASCQAVQETASAALAAAGTVVTEIATPTSAPDLAEVSESVPATPARKATTKESAVGCQMNLVAGRGPANCSRLKSPSRSISALKPPVASTATGNPTSRAVSDFPTR